MSKLSRRGLLSGSISLSAAAVVAAVPSAASAELAAVDKEAMLVRAEDDSDAELIALVNQLFEAEREWDRPNVIYDRLEGAQLTNKSRRGPRGIVAARLATEAAHQRFAELTQRVAEMPARTLQGFIAKARCHAWVDENGNPERDTPRTDPHHDIVRSLVFDLFKFGGVAPAILT